MKAFRDAEHLIQCHEDMFGAPGRRVVEMLLQHAPTLFAQPIEALKLRVVFAPDEMGGYNKHLAYLYPDGGVILLNHHRCAWREGDLILGSTSRSHPVRREDAEQAAEDTIVHELTHIRQAQIIREQRIRVNQTRGCHRDKGWYQAISEAAPKYLGVEVPPSIWPRSKSVRVRLADGRSVVRKEAVPGTLTEEDMCHWPGAVRTRLRKRLVGAEIPATTAEVNP